MNEKKLSKSSGNVFADLGLDAPDERLAKSDLAMSIAQIINKRHLSQTEAAKILGISQPKVSLLLNGQLKGFSMEKLLVLMMALNRDVEIVIKPKPKNQDHGRLRVVYV